MKYFRGATAAFVGFEAIICTVEAAAPYADIKYIDRWHAEARKSAVSFAAAQVWVLLWFSAILVIIYLCCGKTAS